MSGECRPSWSPMSTEVAEELFADTMKRAPWSTNKLRRESFHGRLLRSLTYLTTVRSPAALNDAPLILYRLPDETKEMAHYLSAVAPENRDRVQAIIERALTRGTFRHDWQEVWLYETLANALPLSQPLIEYLNSVADSEDRTWSFVRARALLLLARAGIGDRRQLERAWQLAPAPFKTDVIAAVTWLKTKFPWADQFLQASRTDPVLEVVARPG